MDTTMTPHVKAQWVRLLDVVAIGPQAGSPHGTCVGCEVGTVAAFAQ